MKQTLIAFFITLFIAIVGIGGYMFIRILKNAKHRFIEVCHSAIQMLM